MAYPALDKNMINIALDFDEILKQKYGDDYHYEDHLAEIFPSDDMDETEDDSEVESDSEDEQKSADSAEEPIEVQPSETVPHTVEPGPVPPIETTPPPPDTITHV